MNIAIDEGNNRIKCGLFDQGELQGQHVFNSVSDCLEWIYSQDTHHIAFTTVKSASEFEGKGFLKITTDSDLPISLDYNTPKTLGIDRVCAVIGAMNSNKKSKLIIDLGTCATFEILLEGGIYIGGIISPGLKMRFKAMHNYTNALPLIDGEIHADEKWLNTGKSTVDSMISGVISGMAEEINGTIERFKNTYKIEEIFLTGGDSSLFESYIKESIFVDSNLVLKGVDRIAEHYAHT
jgi:type III pantothenate kinase